MERFVFIAAVTLAVLFGIGAMVGNGMMHFNVDWDDDADSHGISPLVELSAGRVEPQTFSGTSIDIRNAAARVTIIPEDRADISVEIDNPGQTPMPSVSADTGGGVRIDGQLRGRIHDCNAESVNLRDYGEVTLEQMPQITIRAPRRLAVDIGGAGRAEIGATEVLDADFAGCGAATIGDVTEDLTIDMAGSGTVQAGTARSLELDLAGSGELTTGAIANGADIEIAGSGEVTLASVTGALDVSGAGSGSLTVLAGAITDATVELAASGNVEITASVARLDVSIVGSGDVDVNGQVGDIEAEIMGSGNVSATTVTGNVRKEVFGSGDVSIGR